MTSYFGPLPEGDNGLLRDQDWQWMEQQTISAQKIITGSLQAGQEVGSANYVAGSAGWQIDGDGNAEFNDVTVRGVLIAEGGSDVDWSHISNVSIDNADITSLSASKLTSGTINTGTITIASLLKMAAGADIQFVRNSAATISTNDNPQNGDVWIEYRGNDAGAIIGLRKSSGVELVAAQMEVTSDGFEITQGQLLLENVGGGSASVPALAFGVQKNMGLYRPTSGNLGVSVGGAQQTRWNTSGLTIPSGKNLIFDEAVGTQIDASRSGTTDSLHLRSNDRVQIHGGHRALQINPSFGDGNAVLLLNIERNWEFRQRNTGASTALELKSSTNKRFYISDTSNGDIASFLHGDIRMQGRATTTNSSLSAWRNDGFPGDKLLALSSSKEDKKDIRDANPQKYLNRLDQLQPREYRSKAKADDGRRVFLGLVKEEAEKVWPNWTYEAMTVPLLMAVQDLRKRVAELERQVA